MNVFSKILFFLLVTNVFLYLANVNNLLSASNIIGMAISVIIIGIVLGLIPLASIGHSVQWIITRILTIAIFYSVTVPVWPLSSYPLGIGLVTNISNLCSSNPSNIGFLGFLFINSLGVIGIVYSTLGNESE